MTDSSSRFETSQLFRAISANKVRLGHHEMPICRPPKTLPLLVDNIWEMLRPTAYPSRRTVAFANTWEAAKHWAKSEQRTLYQVSLSRPTVVLQLTEISDAKYHPDVDLINQLVSSKTRRYDNLTESLLNADQTRGLLLENGAAIIHSLFNEVTYWKDLVFIENWSQEGLELAGEITYHSSHGYFLSELLT